MLYLNPKENEFIINANPDSIEKPQHTKNIMKTDSILNELNKTQNFPNYESIEAKNHSNKKVKKELNGFEELIRNIPVYKYDIIPSNKNLHKSTKRKNEIDLVPLNLLESNNNCFYDYSEAFLFIGKHCKKYHGKFTREFCKRYLKDCFIIDFNRDVFVPITSNLSQKQFNKYFFHSQRELKYI